MRVWSVTVSVSLGFGLLGLAPSVDAQSTALDDSCEACIRAGLSPRPLPEALTFDWARVIALPLARRESSTPLESQVAPGMDRLCEEHPWVMVVGTGLLLGGLTYLVLDGLGEDPDTPTWAPSAAMGAGGAAIVAIACVL